MDGTHGTRIRELLEQATDTATVIAPFIRVDALRSLLDVVPSAAHFRCVTRWLPREVAAGASDPKILDLLEKRGNFSLSLADRLHAKLYVGGDRCLAGSANVTLAGLGESRDESNIEILVETTTDDPALINALEEISQVERPATREMAEAVSRLAEQLTAVSAGSLETGKPWFPCSWHPEEAYPLYANPPKGYVVRATRLLLTDIATSNLQPGLGEPQFGAAIRSLLSEIPVAGRILGSDKDMLLTRADCATYLQTHTTDDLSTNDLWRAFVNWMAFFFPDQVIKQDITEVALRRAQLLNT